MATLSRSLKLKIRAHQGQQDTFNSRAFCTAALAGTGGGKTVSAYVWLLLQMIARPGMVWLWAEPTRDMITRVILTPRPGVPTLPDFLRRFDTGMVHLKSQGVIRHRLGTIFLVSAENPVSWQGGQIGGVVMDEAGLMKREAYLTAVQRCGFYEGRILIATTPYNMGWLKRDVYDVGIKGDPDFVIINYASTANPNYPKASVERARRTMSPIRFRMLYEGLFGRAEGMIYASFEDERNICDRFEIPESWERFGGLDFGFNHPTTGVWIAKSPDGVYYVYGEYKKGEETFKVHAQAMMSDSSDAKNMVWYSDPSNPEAALEFRREGMSAIEGNNDVLNGIDTVYGLFKTGRLQVFRTMLDTLDEVGSYVWKKHAVSGEFVDEPVKENDDIMDGLRYALHTVEKGGGLQLFV